MEDSGRQSKIRPGIHDSHNFWVSSVIFGHMIEHLSTGKSFIHHSVCQALCCHHPTRLSPQTHIGSASGPRTEGPRLPRAELYGQGLLLSSLSSAPGTWKEPSAGPPPVPISISMKMSHLNRLVRTSSTGQRCHGSRHLKPEGTVGVWAPLRPRGLRSCEALGAFPQLPPQAVRIVPGVCGPSE